MTLGCTLRELNLRMTAAEMRRWWLYYQLEPWGEQRADIRMGISTSALLNAWIVKGKTKPADFIPDWYKVIRRRLQAQSANSPKTGPQIAAAFRMMTQLAGGKIVKANSNGDSRPTAD